MWPFPLRVSADSRSYHMPAEHVWKYNTYLGQRCIHWSNSAWDWEGRRDRKRERERDPPSGTWVAACFSPPENQLGAPVAAYVCPRYWTPPTASLSLSQSLPPSLSLFLCLSPHGDTRNDTPLGSCLLVENRPLFPFCNWFHHHFFVRSKRSILCSCRSLWSRVLEIIIPVYFHVLGMRSKCSPGSQGSTRWPPCSQLLHSQQPLVLRRSSADHFCPGPCRNWPR